MKIIRLRCQEIVKQGLESLFTRMKEVNSRNARDFVHLSLNCRYRHKFKNGGPDGCKKIRTPSLHSCSMENCPYLR